MPEMGLDRIGSMSARNRYPSPDTEASVYWHTDGALVILAWSLQRGAFGPPFQLCMSVTEMSGIGESPSSSAWRSFDRFQPQTGQPQR
jgi:hypothetical protein